MPTEHEKDSTESTEDAVAESRAAHPAGGHPVSPDDCNYCKLYGGSLMMPPHFASAGCKSGGRNHCTCNICF